MKSKLQPSDLLKKVRRIEIKARGLSEQVFAGQYHSAFRGRGMAFSEVRGYQVGDDVRDLDWNVTARYALRQSLRGRAGADRDASRRYDGEYGLRHTK